MIRKGSLPLEMPETPRALKRALRARVRLPLDASERLGAKMLKSPQASARRLGADLLGYVGDRELKARRRRSLASTLSSAIQREADSGVIVALLLALGDCAYPPASKRAAGFATHPEARVRAAAAFAIFGCLDGSRGALPALVKLSSDRSARVRDWATTGLRASVQLWGRRDADVLAALAARLSDSNTAVVGEAIVGLAAAADERARIALKNQIAGGRVDLYMFEAARELGMSVVAADLEARLAGIWVDNVGQN